MGKDYYQTLQLTRSAKDSDIKAAYELFFVVLFLLLIGLFWIRYRRLALKYHPVKNTNDHNAQSKFNDLAEAYEVLSDRMWMFLVESFFVFHVMCR